MHPAQKQQLLPVTAAQEGMWFAEAMDSEYSVNIAQYVDIRGRIDPAVFEECSIGVGRELESCYTRFVDVDGTPMQQVDLDLPLGVQVSDFRGEADPEAAALAWMRADYGARVDMERDLLTESRLLRIADERWLWYVRIHHIQVDGYGGLTLTTRIAQRYNERMRGEVGRRAKVMSIADIVADDQKYRGSSRFEADQEHWAQRAADLPEAITLSRAGSGNQSVGLSAENIVASAELPTHLYAALERANKISGGSAATLTAAFGAFLSAMSGSDDVVLSLPISGRVSKRIRDSAGMLANMVPIRLDTSGVAVDELLVATRTELTGALKHQRYRFEDIRRLAGLRDVTTASFGPIVNIMFFDSSVEIDGATASYHILTSGILEDLRINLYQSGSDSPLRIDLHGNPNKYRPDEIEQHHARFMAYLESFLELPSRRLSEVELFTPGERRTVVEWSEGETRPTSGGCLTDLFAEAVARHADVQCLRLAAEPNSDASTTTTYREFDRATNSVARQFISQGIGPGDIVAITLGRSIEQLLAIYGVIKAGAAYLPLDASAPATRTEQILATAKPRLVIDSLAVPSDDPANDAPITDSERVRPLHPADTAYVLFTSGSTGIPKGVAVSHAAIVNRLEWMQSYLHAVVGDAILYKTPFTFDVSVWELFWPLQVGATLVVAKEDGHRDPGYLNDIIAAERITVVHFVPSMLSVFVAESDRRLPDTLRAVVTSGEALMARDVAALQARSNAELHNLYGPTEAAVDVTAAQVRVATDPVPIGRPVWNTSSYVLDRTLRPVPTGVIGELYLAGDQLATGYIGRPGRTAGTFVACPHRSGERMYRTGDLVRWNSDGVLEYVGRVDFQVKIRGQRVELGEIEQALSAAPGVRSAVVVARDDLAAQPVIVGYVTAADDAHAPDPDEVHAFCATRLPSHMVPTAIIGLREFPLSTAGKIDRRALPTPQLRDDVDVVAPADAVEQGLRDLVASALGLDADRIGMRHNMFAVGGNSITAAGLAGQVRRGAIDPLGPVNVRLADLFEAKDLRELANRIRQSRGPAVGPALGECVADRAQRIPLSYAQNRLWFINQYDTTSAAYNVPGVIGLSGPLDVTVLRQAFADVIDRHESLRTSYPYRDCDPVQQIHPTDDVVAALDLFAQEPTVTVDPTDEIAALVETGFDVAVQVPLRAKLFATGTDQWLLAVAMHHICADGSSVSVLLNDLMVAHQARSANAAPQWSPLPVQYADFAVWQHQLLGDPDDAGSLMARQVDYWTTQLAGAPDLITLPIDRRRPATASNIGASVEFSVDAEQTEAVLTAAQQHGVSPFTIMHSAFALTLGKMGAGRDVVIGVATAGRDEPETAEMVGMFVNTVVLRSVVKPEYSVSDLWKVNRDTMIAALENADTPFERLVDTLAPSRSSGYTPVFQVAMAYQNYAHSELRLSGLQVERASLDPGTAKFDLELNVHEVGSGDRTTLDCEFVYATDLFDEATMATLADRLRAVLAQMVTNPERSALTIDVADRTAAVESTVGKALRYQSFPDLLDEGLHLVDNVSDQPALVGIDSAHGDTQLTYADVARRTNQLGRELISRGIGPGDTVAVAIPRSVSGVLATVAVIKSGAAVMSVDPNYPAARQEMMYADGAARVVLCTRTTEGSLPDQVDRIVLGDADTELAVAGHSSSAIDDHERTRPVSPDDVAYVIFTSGSTGRPKASAVTQRGLANVFDYSRTIFGLDATSRMLAVASPSFDASIFELGLALTHGATLVVSPAEVFAGDELTAVMRDYAVTHAVITPTVLSTLNHDELSCLSVVMTAGEPCSDELVRRWSSGRKLFNLYGPSEVTIWATVAGPITAAERVTIGRAIPGTTAMILDDGLRPTATGVAGELYLVGAQVGRGYLGRPDITAGRFVPNPFGAPGSRMYRTGDVVREGHDGQLIYIGRSDFQLKVRGQRIEPGEIDAALGAHPDVESAVTVGIDRSGSSDKALVGYVVLRANATADADELRAFIAKRLAPHMIPNVITVLERLPRTPVGKIDRAALPVPEFTSAEFAPPRTQLEETVAGVFAEVLEITRVSVIDSFFELGGNSLLATKVVSRLGAALHLRIGVSELFEAPTVSGLCERIEKLRQTPAREPLVARERAAMVPVSMAQKPMWLSNQQEPASARYNVAMAMRLTGSLDLDAFRAAAGDIVTRHESLRTTYPMINDLPMQVIVPADAVLNALEVAPQPVQGPLAEAIAAITGEGFDVTTSAPVRLRLLQVGSDEHVVVFVVHHISADGYSMAPLAHDLMVAYDARARQSEPGWAPLPVQYADFTMWQYETLGVASDPKSEMAAHVDYWRTHLADAPTYLALPTDRPRPASPSHRGGRVRFAIPAPLRRQLAMSARANDCTMFMYLHAAFSVLLARMSGTSDVVIGTPVAGRGDRVLEQVVGMFVNTLALRTSVSNNEPFTDLVARVRRTDLESFAHQDAPIDAVVDAVAAARAATQTPLFQVLFAYQNIPAPVLRVGDLQVEVVDEQLVSAKVDLQLTLTDRDGDDDQPMEGEFLYAAELFAERTIVELSQRFVRVLTEIVEQPAVLVGDIEIRSDDEVEPANDAESGIEATLVEMVGAAAKDAPQSIAASCGGVDVTFADLNGRAQAMAAALGNTGEPDAALTMAVMSALPGLAAGGTDLVADTLSDIRTHATEVLSVRVGE